MEILFVILYVHVPEPRSSEHPITACKNGEIQSTVSIYRQAMELVHSYVLYYLEETLCDVTLVCILVSELGVSDVGGFADDYAFLIGGLLDLFEASQEDTWLEWATLLQQKMVELFWDKKGGGFYSTTDSDHSILLRIKDGMYSESCFPLLKPIIKMLTKPEVLTL